VKLLLPEVDSEQAETVWGSWLAGSTPIFAPALMPFEVTSAIRKQVQRDLITVDRGKAAVEAFRALALDIILIPAADLYMATWALADRYQRPNLYDAYYVALAESLDCPLWTADDHLRRIMPGHASLILSLRNDPPAPIPDL
jgi:predicted nucleic acid-binding protein